MRQPTQIANPVESLTAELYARSDAAQLGLELERFAGILTTIQQKYLGAGASQAAVCELFLSLRIDELVMARACAEGSEAAWNEFVRRYRLKLYDMARNVTREESSARELADALYADLYGTHLRDGERVSKLASYTGRGSLEGWLRTVLAQEFVNRYRKQKRLVSLEEETEGGAQFAAAQPDPIPLDDDRLKIAIDKALAALDGEDRLILASYYLDERTLADVGWMLGQHESTVSRRLVRIAKAVRKQIVAQLLGMGLSRAAAEELLETDVRDVTVDIRKRLAQESGRKTF